MIKSPFLVKRYNSELKSLWNDFVDTSKNATFLFHRDFMDYHSERYEDYSLLVFKNNKLIALLPANKVDGTIFSHQGLSYGSLVLPNKVLFQDVLESVYVVLEFLAKSNIKILIFKQLPKTYHKRPSDEMDYLLFVLNAKLFRKDISMAIPLANKQMYATLRKRHLKLAMSSGLSISLEEDMTSFWNEILAPNLLKRFGVEPTHSLSEITSLREKFPNHIKQYNVYFENELLAGCTVFETLTTAHLQYISTKRGKKVGALDFLIDKLINDVYKNKRYLDFGISNENEGRNINLGLLNWKQSFGASPIVHDFYKIQVDNYQLLKEVLI